MKVFGRSGISSRAVAAFCLCIGLCSMLVFITIRNRSNVERMTMEQLIVEKGIKVTEVISRMLHKTQALAALVIQSNGEIENFDRVAATIIDDPAILNILVAPGGVVSDVYPLQGNEKLVGYSLLGEGAGNREAAYAVQKDALVIGGPFDLMQGGQALVGRLPVWLDAPDGTRFFWGLVSVTLRYPEALEGAGLAALRHQGFAFEIWRVNPDDGQKQIIANSDYVYDRKARYVERHIPILNADWYFRISPVRVWYHYVETWVLIFVSFGISLLIAFVVQNNHELKMMKLELERMVQIDSLTGLLNRKGLFIRLERLAVAGKTFDLHYMDLNYFKQINDLYGHNVGDFVLREFSRKIVERLDESRFLARISGDEFILVHIRGDAEADSDEVFWRGIDEVFSEDIYTSREGDIRIHFSRGVACYPEEGGTIDEIISIADERMYDVKRQRISALRGRRHDDDIPGTVRKEELE